MTLVDYARHPGTLLAGLGRGVNRAIDRLAKSIAYSRLCAELDRLSDGELADIGIDRVEIPRRAWETVYGEPL